MESNTVGRAGTDASQPVVTTRPREGGGRFWDYFSDPEALVNALAFKMTSLIQSRGMNDGLTMRVRIAMGKDDVESSSKFVSYLQNGSPSEFVFLGLVQWMKSDSGNLAHLLRTDAPGELFSSPLLRSISLFINSILFEGAGQLPEGSLFVEPTIC